MKWCKDILLNKSFSVVIFIFALAVLALDIQAQKQQNNEVGFVTTADSIQLYYERFGDGEQKIILAGGMYLSPSFRHLGNGDRTLIIYDQRARGRSTAISDNRKLGWQKEIEDIEAIRKHFAIEKASLIGWSYSGAIMALYAEKYPTHVERMVQIGPIVPRKDPYFESYLHIFNERRDSSYHQKIAMVEAVFKDSREIENYIKDFYLLLHKPM